MEKISNSSKLLMAQSGCSSQRHQRIHLTSHNSRSNSLHESGGAVHTEYNVNAARGTEAWKPQAATQAPFYLFYKEILGMIL